jgi:hypothetical protein
VQAATCFSAPPSQWAHLHDADEQGVLSHTRQLGHIEADGHDVALLVHCHLLSGAPHDVGAT